ncbi:alpha/beta fold hydrolase [Candidatus Protochlamydia phocaeensis]|uniref:alpha/beta fold hydrolase n=1 Tax=Candidatus Protochlamydia phocaeensis TaxID=1414722 RepID=UPI001896A2F0|nr:alpha/beta fold hydrolase [Candidatus Protochlamydia phocaeensis]
MRKGRSFWEWPASFGKQAIHYIEQGEGEKHILLLHGFASHTYTWRYQIPFLAAEGYHVWALDYMGHGLSDKPAISYQFKHFLELIKSFMQAQGISKVHAIGNSMGGSLALALAANYPQMVCSLTLLDAVAYPFNMPFIAHVGKIGGKLLFPFINETAIRLFLRQIVSDPSHITQEQVQAYLLPFHLKGGKEALIEMIKHFDFQTMMQLYRRFSLVVQPLLVIWGKDDAFIPLSHFHRFGEDFPYAQSQLIAQAGHIPQEEQPKRVNEILGEFLNSCNKGLP